MKALASVLCDLRFSNLVFDCPKVDSEPVESTSLFLVDVRRRLWFSRSSRSSGLWIVLNFDLLTRAVLIATRGLEEVEDNLCCSLILWFLHIMIPVIGSLDGILGQPGIEQRLGGGGDMGVLMGESCAVWTFWIHLSQVKDFLSDSQ